MSQRKSQRKTPTRATKKRTDIASVQERLFFNRELSWLAFNRRVLDEAAEYEQPLLEQLKFLSIFSSNLDEFFMIRVSGLKEQVAEGVTVPSQDGLTPAEQLTAVRKKLAPALARQTKQLGVVLEKLEGEGITIESFDSLDQKEKRKINKYFREHLFPILTPQSVDSSHPFPYISNLSLNLGLFIEPSKARIKKHLKHLFKQRRFARVKIPASVPRLFRIDPKGFRFVLLEEIIAANIDELFPRMKTSEAFLFRVTRDADIEVREDEARDLLRTMENVLHRRRFGSAVRLEVESTMPAEMLKILSTGIGIAEKDVYKIEGLINIPDLMQIHSLDLPHLKDSPVHSSNPGSVSTKTDLFELLKKRDILLHHPYTSFSLVSDFVEDAAEDDDVQAIKICLYRAGKDSPIVRSLIKAVRNGKQVTALVELRARFDEENNIEWAKLLENEGVHVVYGISGLKTHSKVLLIARREGKKLIRYAHIGTGNYNPVTAKLYTDLAIMTTDPLITSDATELFNFLTGYSQQNEYRRLLVAPLRLREGLVDLIRAEKTNRLKGKDARIVMKVNSLTDAEIIEELYAASQAGVEIDLIVRGICALRPGVLGLSETITVKSIVGRFLEHSRVFYFAGAGDEKIYIGSADIMVRNLDHRVEVLVPILDAGCKRYIKDVLLEAYARDNVNARTLQSDGRYLRILHGKNRFDSQIFFFEKEART